MSACSWWYRSQMDVKFMVEHWFNTHVFFLYKSFLLFLTKKTQSNVTITVVHLLVQRQKNYWLQPSIVRTLHSTLLWRIKKTPLWDLALKASLQRKLGLLSCTGTTKLLSIPRRKISAGSWCWLWLNLRNEERSWQVRGRVHESMVNEFCPSWHRSQTSEGNVPPWHTGLQSRNLKRASQRPQL